MWIAVLALAAVLVAVSVVLVVRANPRSHVPWFGRPEHDAPWSLVLRNVGLFLGLVGGLVLVPDSQRGWFVVGVVALLLPAFVIQAVHNARVDRSGGDASGS